MGDALGCAIVQKMCEKELAEMDRENELKVANLQLQWLINL